MTVITTIIDAILTDARVLNANIPYERGIHSETDTKYLLNLGADDKIEIPKDIYEAYLNGNSATVDINRVLATYKPGTFEALNL